MEELLKEIEALKKEIAKLKENQHESLTIDEITCENCEKSFTYKDSDVNVVELGLYAVTCPHCKYSNYVTINGKDGIELSENNIKFPQHFYHFCIETGVKSVSNEEITNNIKKGINFLKENPSKYIWFIEYGELFILCQKFEEDEEIRILVTQNYYDSSIKL